MRGWMQHEHARASSLLCRFGSRRPWAKILAHQAPPPCHLATCRRRGEATIRRDLDGRPQPPPLLLLQLDAERLTVPRPDNKMKPYGAPKVKRRGESHAGAPLLKRQEADIRASGRLAWIKSQTPTQESYIGDHCVPDAHRCLPNPQQACRATNIYTLLCY